MEVCMDGIKTCAMCTCGRIFAHPFKKLPFVKKGKY